MDADEAKLHDAYEIIREATLRAFEKHGVDTGMAASVIATAIFAMGAWGSPGRASRVLTLSYSESNLADLRARILADAIAQRMH